METDPGIWLEPEIGCPPSTPHPALNDLSVHACTLAVLQQRKKKKRKKVPFSPDDVNFQSINLGKRGARGGPDRELSVQLLKFTLDFYELKYQSMTSRKVKF